MKDIKKMLKELVKKTTEQRIEVPESVRRMEQVAKEASLQSKILRGKRG